MKLQQLDLQAFDVSYPTRNPAHPLVGLDVISTVRVTIKWNDTRTSLALPGIDTGDPKEDGVTYDNVRWQAPGSGPFDLYEQTIASLQKVGTVAWSVRTTTQVENETNAATQKSRLIVTPQVELLRKVVRLDGTGATESVYISKPADPIYGQWA